MKGGKELKLDKIVIGSMLIVMLIVVVVTLNRRVCLLKVEKSHIGKKIEQSSERSMLYQKRLEELDSLIRINREKVEKNRRLLSARDNYR